MNPSRSFGTLNFATKSEIWAKVAAAGTEERSDEVLEVLDEVRTLLINGKSMFSTAL